jgi:hypothetical protein
MGTNNGGDGAAEMIDAAGYLRKGDGLRGRVNDGRD